MGDPTTASIKGGVATITLDAQERRNALGRAVVDSLLANLSDAIATDGVRVIVLTNARPVFSSGADVKDGPNREAPWQIPFHEVIDAVDRSPKPVIACVAGHAAGGAACLATMCDFAVAVDTARIGITEVRLGLPPADVVAYLARRVPYRSLVEALLTGEMMTAQRAVELGLLNAAVWRGSLGEVRGLWGFDRSRWWAGRLRRWGHGDGGICLSRLFASSVRASAC